MATIETLAQAAKAVYKNNEDFVDWHVLRESSQNKNGFYAVAYKNDATNEIIVSYRGTTPTDSGDLIADKAIAIGENRNNLIWENLSSMKFNVKIQDQAF